MHWQITRVKKHGNDVLFFLMFLIYENTYVMKNVDIFLSSGDAKDSPEINKSGRSDWLSWGLEG